MNKIMSHPTFFFLNNLVYQDIRWAASSIILQIIANGFLAQICAISIYYMGGVNRPFLTERFV